MRTISLNDWDLKQIDEKGSVQSGEFQVMKREIFTTVFDDTYIRMSPEMVKEFKEFIRKRNSQKKPSKN